MLNLHNLANQTSVTSGFISDSDTIITPKGSANKTRQKRNIIVLKWDVEMSAVYMMKIFAESLDAELKH